MHVRATIGVRPYHPCDIPHLMHICLKTGNDGDDGSELYSDQWFIGQLYVLPYVTHSPELCLVAEKDGVPVGYILGASDTEEFYRWMEDDFLPPLRLRYPPSMSCRSEVEEFFLSRLHIDKTAVPVSPEYPAHLHINLLPDAQGRGLGSQLLQRFTDILTGKNVPGVYLHTGPDNLVATRFYEKHGFTLIEENPGSVKMARRLTDV